MRLKNKTAVISGATGGIGEATSKLFLAEGANVVMVGRDEEKLNTLHNSFKDQSKLSTYVADSNDEDAIKDCITFAKDKYGSIDVVFANAGTEGDVKPLTEYTKDEFNNVISVNVIGVWLYMKHVLPIMQNQKNGSFIAVASAAGVVGFNGTCPYVASKHAVCGMIKTACIENGPFNVRVNALAPGPVDNRMMRSLEEQLNPDDPDSVREMIMQQLPLQKYATNNDIANLALFLGSDDSCNSSGGVYLSDGGFTSA